LPHEHRGEIPVAAIIWNDGEDKDSLLEYASDNLARYKIPRRLFTTDSLPRVNGWKLLRRQLKRDLYKLVFYHSLVMVRRETCHDFFHYKPIGHETRSDL
ncbi:MAG: hypothetical protein IJA00_00405, partial [Bacteroidaceae bacterium]|nr:hypothetical protein [Bacteroidaceae bacterium]